MSKLTAALAEGRGLEMHDRVCAALCFIFGLFSIIWPDTGRIETAALTLMRGYATGPLWLLTGLALIWFATRDWDHAPAFMRFFRQFYPELLFGFLFFESIRLSSQTFGGTAHDAFFSALDERIFGFQPSRAFAAALSNRPVWNEIMFAAYFSFYLMLMLTPMIPYFKGNIDESEREISIFSLYMLCIFTFYVFFRVEGPKYWLNDLAQQGYGQFKGGLCTLFFARFVFQRTELSGAAFPSSHVAVSVMMTIFVARTNKRLLPLYIILCMLIALATVYIYAHWAVDAMAGFASAIIFVPLADLFCRRAGKVRTGLRGARIDA